MEGQEISSQIPSPAETPAEVRKAESMLTPVQAVMTKARSEVLSHEQDLIAAGVTKQQVKDASDKAGERVRLEFEQKEKEDPLRRIEEALENAAETPEERQQAQEEAGFLEEFRSRWASWAKREGLRAKYAGKTFDFKEKVIEGERSNRCPGYVFRRGNDQLYTYTSSFLQHSSVAFKERVLKGLGALEANEHLDDLKLMPKDTDTEYSSVLRTTKRESVRVPTKITGVDVRVHPESQTISASIDLPTLQKVVNFPEAA